MKTIIITILAGILSVRANAQTAESALSRWSVSLEVLTQTTGVYAESLRFPGIKTQFGGGKGLQPGVEYVHVDKKHGQLFQNLTLMRYGSGKETGLMVATSLGYRRRIAAAYVEAQAGIGYLQTTFREDKALQSPCGDFFTERFRVGGLTPTVALGAGYHVNKKWKIYLRYYHHAQLQTELNPGGVRLHRSLNLGIGLSV